jgi:hypothetical protein
MSNPLPILPSDETLRNAYQLSLNLDKPVYSDYWQGSYQTKFKKENTVFIGAADNADSSQLRRLIMPDSNAYTSEIIKLYKSSEEIIVETENSLYIVSGHIKKKAERRV